MMLLRRYWLRLFLVLPLILANFSLAESKKKQPIPSLERVASLVDPGKLSKLKAGSRAANSRFRKLMFFIHEAEIQGIRPKAYLARIYQYHRVKPYTGDRHVFAPEVEKLNLEVQYHLGKLYGLFSRENLPRLRKGLAPVVTKGTYRGDKAEVDHLIPYRIAPELEQSMANLTWLPASLNRSKGSKIKKAARRRMAALKREVNWELGGSVK